MQLVHLHFLSDNYTQKLYHLYFVLIKCFIFHKCVVPLFFRELSRHRSIHFSTDIWKSYQGYFQESNSGRRCQVCRERFLVWMKWMDLVIDKMTADKGRGDNIYGERMWVTTTTTTTTCEGFALGFVSYRVGEVHHLKTEDLVSVVCVTGGQGRKSLWRLKWLVQIMQRHTSKLTSGQLPQYLPLFEAFG